VATAARPRTIEPLAYCQMAAGAGAAAEQYAILEDGRPGQARLTGDQAEPPDAAIVTNLHEVVDLRALADHSIAERATVDGRIRADLDLVLDD
jgi:hypothetical protein